MAAVWLIKGQVWQITSYIPSSCRETLKASEMTSISPPQHRQCKIMSLAMTSGVFWGMSGFWQRPLAWSMASPSMFAPNLSVRMPGEWPFLSRTSIGSHRRGRPRRLLASGNQGISRSSPLRRVRIPQLLCQVQQKCLGHRTPRLRGRGGKRDPAPQRAKACPLILLPTLC